MSGQELTLTQRAEQALSFSDTRKSLAYIVAKSANIVAVTNQDGREECHRALMVLRNTRIEIQKRGKDAREDATAFSKAVIKAEKELIDVVTPEEERLEALRNEWDDAREREKQAKIVAEAKRVEAIQKRIADIRGTPALLAQHSADEMLADIADLQAMQIGEEFGEFIETALDARDGAVLRLQEMQRVAADREEQQRQEAAAREAERLQIEADRKELERLRAEQAEQQRAAEAARAEADRLAAVEREREAAEMRAKLQAEAEAQRARDAAEAEQRRQEQEATAQRLREQEARLQADREALAAKQREQDRAAVEKAIAEATLVGAAQDAIWLLGELGQAEHITTKKLAAALSRESLAAAA